MFIDDRYIEVIKNKSYILYFVLDLVHPNASHMYMCETKGDKRMMVHRKIDHLFFLRNVYSNK